MMAPMFGRRSLFLLAPIALVACGPTVGPLGPDAHNVEAQHTNAPRFVETGNCTWRGSAYRCPGEPVTVQLRHDEDADAVMWKNCPAGFVVNRTDEVPIGSTSVASTYKSGGVNDPIGPVLGRKENTYTETKLVTERRITFTCRERPLEPESEVVCATADVRSCVRKPAPEAR